MSDRFKVLPISLPTTDERASAPGCPTSPRPSEAQAASEDALIDTAAARVLATYRAAFEELAK